MTAESERALRQLQRTATELGKEQDCCQQMSDRAKSGYRLGAGEPALYNTPQTPSSLDPRQPWHFLWQVVHKIDYIIPPCRIVVQTFFPSWRQQQPLMLRYPFICVFTDQHAIIQVVLVGVAAAAAAAAAELG